MTASSAQAEEATASSAIQELDAWLAAGGLGRTPDAAAAFAEGFTAGIAAGDRAREADETAVDCKRDAWLDFEDEFLIGRNGGRVAAQVFDACEQAFERAWPDRIGAYEAAKAAFLAIHPKG